MSKVSFGARLKAARLQAGLTQEQLGARLGKGQREISAWECDRCVPGLRRLPAIAAALGITEGELFSIQAERGS